MSRFPDPRGHDDAVRVPPPLPPPPRRDAQLRGLGLPRDTLRDHVQSAVPVTPVLLLPERAQLLNSRLASYHLVKSRFGQLSAIQFSPLTDWVVAGT